MTRTHLLVFCALLAGCSGDSLYTYCDDAVQCGTRTEDDVEYDLECIEVTIEVTPAETTVGNFCTLACDISGDCDSRIGLANGRCVRLEGDDESFCYQRCDNGEECYPSSRCETLNISGGETRLCVPTRTPG